MKAPRYWSNSPDAPGWQAALLAPAAWIWQLGAGLRQRRVHAERAPVPVLCVGNLTAGGAGKSPMVAALMRRTSERGINTHVVSRGYGGRLGGPHEVNERTDTHVDVGDEPLMLSALGPVWVSRDRTAGARAAAAAGAELILLDDGFQNPGLHKDAAIVMIDAGAGFGNGRVIPAGPLREQIDHGLARTDLVVLVGTSEQRAATIARWPALNGVKSVGAELRPLQTGLIFEGDPVYAFCGIGRPEKFFETLRGMGAHLVGTQAFADHHPYSPAILRRLIADAHARNAMLVTTEKDAVRIPATHRGDVMTVQVTLEPEGWAPIDALLDDLVPANAQPPKD